jgi:DNA-binding NarL/FixJ family response regulator
LNPNVAAKILALFHQFIVSTATINNYKLTDREKEILLLLTEGMPMPRIAEKIFLGYETIRGYVKDIYYKPTILH